MKNLQSSVFLVCIVLIIETTWVYAQIQSDIKFKVSFQEGQYSKPQDGRLLLLLANNNDKEPRFQILDGPETQLAFGIDVENLNPGEWVLFDDTVFGYPIKNMSSVPAGEYWVQGLFHIYETFHRADGHIVKLPMDRGEGQQWNKAPGNLYNTPQKIIIDPIENDIFEVVLDQKIPPITPPKDTKYVKHIKMKSKLLSEFWGRPMYLGACVLLPEGFDEHPTVKYPLIINHGHFPHTFSDFRETPPDPNLEPEYSKRFNVEGYNRIMQQKQYEFYKEWTGPNFPRWVVIQIQHANPYYDDSYAVNSENLGPYGDAITYELIPFIEGKFRCIGESWSRFLYGGSTGGWEALAAQIMYPDEYNGCFAACPDPIDFRAYTVVNIYEHKNAYYVDSKYKRTPRPATRNYLGEVAATLEEVNHRELVLGTKSRSGRQWDIWEAVYSPVGVDGYPKRMWDKLTGEIDPEVPKFWRENYDLGYILKRDWKTIGPKLKGKIHIYCGDMDNYYLNNAVYLVEEFLESTTNPYYDGEVDYGDRAEHCWNGDQNLPNHLSRLRYHQMYNEKILKRIKNTAPVGTDLTSWQY
jgi:hypothetical protein